MPIYTSQIKGLVAGISVKVNTATSENTGYWIKVARVSTQTDFDTSQSVFLFTFPGLDMYTDHRYRNTFILIARYTPSNSGTYIDADGTMLELSSINANEINGFDPSTDIALLYNNENGDGGAEIWIKIPDRRVNVMVTPLSSTVETGSGSDFNNLGFEIVDGETTTNNFQSALPAEHIRNAADNADVDYGTVNGSWTDKIVGSLTLADNVIKASDGGTAITLDTSSNVILSAKLRVPQYIEHNGDTDTRINFSTADKMVLEAGGVEMLSLSETTQNAVIVNDGGADVDFRVEGSSDANAFFVRGSDNNVGIGTNTPDSDLEVYNAGVTEVRITGNNTGDARLRIDNGSSNHYIFDDQSDSNNFGIEAASGKALIFNTDGANERMRITSGGLVGIGTDNPGAKLEVNGDVRIFDPAVGSDPFLQIGTSATECLQIKSNIVGSSQELYQVEFASFTASSTANRAQYTFAVDGTTILTVGDGGLVVNTGNITGDITGNAGSADTIDTTATSASANYYLTFVDSSSSTSGETLRVDSGLYYNPNTNNLVITGDLYVRGGQINGPVNNYLMLVSDTHMYFDIDNDNDGAASFYFRNGGNTTIAELDESGNLQIDGDLTISGGNITTALTVDGDLTLGSTILKSASNVNIRANGSMYLDIDDDNNSDDNFFAFRHADTNQMVLDEHGNLTTTGNLNVNGGTINGPNAAHFKISSDGHLDFVIDEDNNSTTAEFRWFDDGTERMVLDQSGNLQIDGDLTISGGNITNSTTFNSDITVNGGDIIVEQSGAGAGDIYLRRNNASIVEGNEYGRVMIGGRESSGTAYTAGAITLRATENFVANSNHGCQLKFFTTSNGGNVNSESMIIHQSGAVQCLRGVDVDMTEGSGMLIVGSVTGQHLAIDGNEIDSKASGTTNGNLYLNNNSGGNVSLAAGGGQVHIVTPSGARCGIGYASPAHKLDVLDNRASNYTMRIWNDGNNSNRYGLNILSGADDGGGTNYAIRISDGNGHAIGYVTFSGTTVTYGAFTGVHPALIEESDNPFSSEAVLADPEDPTSTVDMINWYPRGTLLKTNSTSYQSTEGSSNVVYSATKTSTSKDKSVLGVYLAPHRPDQWLDLHDVGCVGDGEILVCIEGGDLEIGDYICSSNTPGHGMKQDDDLLHNYTVAKSLENVNWSELGVTQKLVKCSFHAT